MTEDVLGFVETAAYFDLFLKAPCTSSLTYLLTYLLHYKAHHVQWEDPRIMQHYDYLNQKKTLRPWMKIRLGMSGFYYAQLNTDINAPIRSHQIR